MVGLAIVFTELPVSLGLEPLALLLPRYYTFQGVFVVFLPSSICTCVGVGAIRSRSVGGAWSTRGEGGLPAAV